MMTKVISDEGEGRRTGGDVGDLPADLGRLGLGQVDMGVGQALAGLERRLELLAQARRLGGLGGFGGFGGRGGRGGRGGGGARRGSSDGVDGPWAASAGCRTASTARRTAGRRSGRSWVAAGRPGRDSGGRWIGSGVVDDSSGPRVPDRTPRPRRWLTLP